MSLRIAPLSLIFCAITGALAQVPPATQDDSLLANLTPRQLGPTTMGGRIADIAVYNKEPRIFYVGTASGGVWKTTNGGMTLSPVFDDQVTSSIGAVAVCQTNPDIVYVGTGEASSRNSVSWGEGVFKSTDGGKTWKNLGLAATRHIARIQIDPRNPDVVYVAAQGQLWGTNPERGVYKTTDGGATWKLTLSVDDKTGATDLQMNPKNPNELICAMWQRVRTGYDFTSGGPGSAIYRTTDGGKAWHRVSNGLPPTTLGRVGLSYFAKNPKVVMATVEAAAKPAKDAKETPTKYTGLYKSTDGGENWKQISKLNPRPFYFSRPQLDPVDENRIYIVATNFHVSENGGTDFKTQQQSIHVDFHAIWVDPEDNRHIIVGQDGGLAQTRDRGATWEHLNNLAIGQYYAVAFDYRKPYWVYGGLQDNGSWGLPTQTVKGGPAYYDALSVGGGDGFYVQVDPTDPTIVYSESQGGAISRYDMSAGTSRYIVPRTKQGDGVRFNWDTPFVLSPFNPKTLFIGGNKLFRSVDMGDSWLAISPDLSTNDPNKLHPGRDSVTPEDTGAERHCTITTISPSPLNQQMIVVGTDDGLVQLTRDEGRTWKEVGSTISGLPKNTWCSRVIASKWVEGRIYALFDGHRANDYKPYAFVSEDYGTTWTRIDAGLPDYDCLYVIREGVQNPDLLYLGSDRSLRVSLDRGKTWVRWTKSFPTVPVYDLVIHPRDLDMIVGTHGRSIWTIDVSALEQMTTESMAADAALFKPQNVLLIGFADSYEWGGDRVYQSKNTQPGTRIYYNLKAEAKGDVQIIVSDVTGKRTTELDGTKKAGLNVVRWSGRLGGRMADPGDYRITLKVDGKEFVSSVRVEAAPLISK